MKKSTLTYKIAMILLLLCQAGWMQAMVYQRAPYVMTQPNGDSVTVYLYGDDLYIEAESVDHYTLTKDEKSGEICYALLSADEREYASSGIVYKGGNAPEAVKMLVEPSIRISKESRDEKIAQAKKSIHRQEGNGDKPQLRAATVLPDTVYGLCLLIDFRDVHSNVTVDQVNIFLNGDNNPIFNNSMSIKEYFQWISSGKLTYINYLPEKYYTTPENKSYYAPNDATDYTIDKLNPEIRNAINAWANEKPQNLERLTKNTYGGIKALNILYAGKCDNKWGTGLWPHQSVMQLKLDGNVFNRYVWHTYQISDIDQRLTMGTFVHENGHLVCDWPDFYQYEEHEENNASKYNVGDAFSISSETNPTYPNAWALDQMGWLTNKQDITDIKGGKTISLKKGVGHAAIYRGTGKNAQEIYYLEVREKHYGTKFNNDKGIFIWHVNGAGDNNYPGHDELLECRPATDRNPFWVRGNGPDHFSDDTNPSAKWHDGNNSSIYLWDFSDYSETMTFRCGAYIETPEFTKEELRKGGVNNEYRDTLTFLGGDEPYRTTIYTGKLPDGIYLNEEGILYGTPDKVGEEKFTIRVTDAHGKYAFKEYQLAIISSEPFNERPCIIPGSFQMEEFDKGGNGIAYQTNKTGDYIRNDGALFPLYRFSSAFAGTLGYAIIYNENREWTQYTIDVRESGQYEMTLRNATNYDAKLGISIDQQRRDEIQIPGVANAMVTSNSRGYKYTKKILNLPAGIHTLRFTTEDVTHPLYVDSVAVSFVSLLPTGTNEFNNPTPYLMEQNPSKGTFNLLGTQGGETIQVYTITGEWVETLYGKEDNTRFGAHYPVGIYILQIQSDTALVTLKATKTQ